MENYEDPFAAEEAEFADDGPQLQTEAKAFERVGPSGILAELLSGGAGGLDTDSKKRMRDMSPEDRFLIFTDAMCRRMDSDGIVKLSERDITNILEKTRMIPDLKYKNHVAYILGYIASEGGRSMRVDRVRFVIEKVLPSVGQEGGVEPADVVRYAKYWNTFL
jgi:hypothetical protein